MRKILFLLSFIVLNVYGCGSQKPQSFVQADLPPVAIDNSEGANTLQTTHPANSPAIDETQHTELKEYPVLLAVDPHKAQESIPQREVLFSVFHEALVGTFALYNAQDQELALQKEAQQRGVSGSVIPQDLLFEQFNQADVCVYLWAKIEEKEEQAFGITATFYFPTVECRVVDMISGRELARLSESPGKMSPKKSSHEEKQRYAIEQTAKTVAQKLKQRINTIVPQIIKQTYHIRGTLVAKREAEKLQRILQDMVVGKDIKIKKTHSESTFFDYEVISRSQGISELAEQIRENANDAGMEIWVRTSRRIIDISDRREEQN